jgi:hypothetical protein
MYSKKIFIVFILLFTFAYAKSQDKIVTTKGDTIFFIFVSVSLDFIKYEKRDYNQTSGNYSIPMRQVQEYSMGPRTKESDTNSEDVTPIENTRPVLEENSREENSFSTPVKKKPAADPFSPASYRKQKSETSSRWRIGIQGGGSYLINSLAHSRQAMKDLGVNPAAQADDYYNKLRLGLSAGADVYYLINPSFGVGVKGSGFYSTVQKNYTVGGYYGDDETFASTINEVSQREKLYLYYVGPSVLFQQWITENHKFRLNEEISVGYIFFRDMSQFDPNLYTFVNPDTGENINSISKTGNTFSGTAQLSLEYYPASHVSVG